MSMNQQRIEACATFLQDTMDAEDDEFPGASAVDGDFFDEMIRESALSAGFTEPEIEAAWSWINEQEGA